MAGPTKRQRIINPHQIDEKAGSTCVSFFELLDDPILREIIAFLPDPETVCTLGGCCTRLQNLVKGETAIWDKFLEQIPFRARPKKSGHGDGPEPTAKEIVLRFSSARLFASRMERLAPLHRVLLGQGNYCAGCDAFPDATGYGEGKDLALKRRGDAFFVRYSLSGSLLWQGFLPSHCSNWNISLGDDEFDLSEEFDWPEMKAYLAHPRPTLSEYPDRNSRAREFYEEKRRMARTMYKNLTLTIVVIKDDITDRHLGICTCGPDEDNPLYRTTYMEVMPFLSHGVSIGPVDAVHHHHLYYRTSEDEIHCGGGFIAARHQYRDRYSTSNPNEFLPQKYIGPVFGTRSYTYGF